MLLASLVLIVVQPVFAVSSSAYVFKTNFGLADPRQKVSFTTQHDLEEYLHSFGYLSEHMVMKSSSNLLSNSQYITYYVPYDNSVYFKGTFNSKNVLYGDYNGANHLHDEGLFATPELYIEYAFQNDFPNAVITDISPKEDWQYNHNQMLAGDDDQNPDPDSKYNYVYSRDYAVTYDDLESKNNYIDYTVDKYAEMDCIPPEPDNFGPYEKYLPHPYGFYVPADHTQDGSCTNSYLVSIVANVSVRQTAGDGDDNQSCKMSADPVDVTTGRVYEAVTDFVIHSPNPITFKRYYARRGQSWLFSYSRHLIPDGKGNITLVQDDGDQYLFTKKSDGSFSPPGGSFGELSYHSNGAFYTYNRVDGKVETYGSNGLLTKITDPAGFATTISHAVSSGLTIISDGFGHEIKMQASADGKSLDIILPNNHKISYQFTNALQHAITSVTYPNGSTVSYVYQEKNGALPLLTKIEDGNQANAAAWSYSSDDNAISNIIYR